MTRSPSSIRPTTRCVLGDGGRVGYDYLVVAVGIKLNWGAIKGMSADLVGRDGICSNYLYEGCEGTWRTLQQFAGGTAIFTNPPPPIKCAGAPQKIMYLADDHFRKRGVRGKSRIVFASGTPGIFSVKAFAKTLNDVIARKGIETMFKHKLVEIRPDSHEAVFEQTETGEQTTSSTTMIHVTPPQGPPEVIKNSPLAERGRLGQRRQAHAPAPGLPERVLARRRVEPADLEDRRRDPQGGAGAGAQPAAPCAGKPTLGFKRYDGYASCPLTTGYGKLVLAEFDYDLKPAPSFPFDTTKERWSMYQLKRYGLPALYWRGMLKGRAEIQLQVV